MAFVNAQEINQSLSDLKLSISPTALQLEVPKPNFWNYFRIKVSRSLTFSINKKIELTNKLSSMRLLAIQQNPENKLDSELKNFEKEKNQIYKLKQKYFDKIADSTKNDLAKTEILQMFLLNSLNSNNPSDILIKNRDAIFVDAVKNLHDIDKSEVSETINAVDRVIEENENSPEDKISKKLELTNELNNSENSLEEATNEIDDNDDFDQAILESDDSVENEISKLPEETFQKVVDLISVNLQRNLIILESVLNKVPENAKPALQKVIDSATKRMVERLQNEDDLIEKMFNGTKVSDEIQNKIIERIKHEAEKQNKSIEKAIEKFDKQEEKQTEENKKQIEKKSEETKKSKENKSEGSRKTTEIQSSDSNSNLSTDTSGSDDNSDSIESSSTTTKVEKQEIEIKAKDMAFEKTSYTLKKNAQVTIKFENDDSAPHSLVLNDYGLSTAVIAKDSKATLTFVAVNNTTFHCGVHSSMTGTIIVQ